jgi:hypothetical protein
METTVQQTLATSVVNGLIAVTILWIFWTPFIIFLVVPLVNAQLKEAVCLGTHSVRTEVGGIKSDIFYKISKFLSESIRIPESEIYNYLNSIFPSLPNDPGAYAPIAGDVSEITSLNMSRYITMTVTAIVVCLICLGLAFTLIQIYSLDYTAIIKFNAVMAIIIMVIEMGFFAGVAMKYISFMPTDVIQQLESKLKSYANTVQ